MSKGEKDFNIALIAMEILLKTVPDRFKRLKWKGGLSLEEAKVFLLLNKKLKL